MIMRAWESVSNQLQTWEAKRPVKKEKESHSSSVPPIDESTVPAGFIAFSFAALTVGSLLLLPIPSLLYIILGVIYPP